MQTVQIELNPEYVKWPRACVCCSAPDERDLEIAVGSTDIAEHEQDVIMEVRIPYCLNCYAHTEIRIGWWRMLAVFLSVMLVGFFAAVNFAQYSGAAGIACLVAFVGYAAFEFAKIRRSMSRFCTAPNNQVRFAHPTNSRLSTMQFSNNRVAEQLRELNRFNVVER